MENESNRQPDLDSSPEDNTPMVGESLSEGHLPIGEVESRDFERRVRDLDSEIRASEERIVELLEEVKGNKELQSELEQEMSNLEAAKAERVNMIGYR